MTIWGTTKSILTPEPRPIFVVGAPRSGTTLVSKILGRHPEIQAAGETHYFEEIWANRKQFGELKSRSELEIAVARLLTVFGRFNQIQGQAIVDRRVRPNDLVQKALQYGGGYDSLYIAFTQSLNDSNDALRYCDDTPKHLFYLNSLLHLFPQARIIICIRDPRDFLCSYKNFWRASRDPRRIKALYHPIISATLWRTSANLILNNRLVGESDKIMTLHYESLVAEPETQVKKLCAFTGLTYSDSMLAVDSHNSAFSQSQPGIFQESVGKWSNCLNPEEIWWVQRLNQKQMAKFGYETSKTTASPARLAAALLSTPPALLKALKANHGRRGPLLPYILKRIRP